MIVYEYNLFFLQSANNYIFYIRYIIVNLKKQNEKHWLKGYFITAIERKTKPRYTL